MIGHTYNVFPTSNAYIFWRPSCFSLIVDWARCRSHRMMIQDDANLYNYDNNTCGLLPGYAIRWCAINFPGSKELHWHWPARWSRHFCPFRHYLAVRPATNYTHRTYTLPHSTANWSVICEIKQLRPGQPVQAKARGL